MPLTVQITKAALKYCEHLDSTTQKRIKEKLRLIADDPLDVRHSKPLVGNDKRSARVGSYRILFLIVDETLVVTDINPRGDIYRSL